jgi:hypothetical protein
LKISIRLLKNSAPHPGSGLAANLSVGMELVLFQVVTRRSPDAERSGTVIA